LRNSLFLGLTLLLSGLLTAEIAKGAGARGSVTVVTDCGIDHLAASLGLPLRFDDPVQGGDLALRSRIEVPGELLISLPVLSLGQLHPNDFWYSWRAYRHVARSWHLYEAMLVRWTERLREAYHDNEIGDAFFVSVANRKERPPRPSEGSLFGRYEQERDRTNVSHDLFSVLPSLLDLKKIRLPELEGEAARLEKILSAFTAFQAMLTGDRDSVDEFIARRLNVLSADEVRKWDGFLGRYLWSDENFRAKTGLKPREEQQTEFEPAVIYFRGKSHHREGDGYLPLNLNGLDPLIDGFNTVKDNMAVSVEMGGLLGGFVFVPAATARAMITDIETLRYIVTLWLNAINSGSR
jgi:hypothetical protein